MLKVGITGGIGTGKSTVCKIFACLGVPVLDTDALAKQLMNTNAELQYQLQQSFGDDVIVNGQVLRKIVASRAFASEQQTQLLNKIVHPHVFAAINDWDAKQTAKYTIRESALLIETGSNKNVDIIIGITAPKQLRIQRLLNRDITSSVADITARMDRQMEEEEKQKYYQYTIANDGEQLLIPQVLYIHQQIINRL
jgi:dephospho-CoA kinase